MYQILADTHIYRLNEFIPDQCALKTFDPSSGVIPIDSNTDALLIRTVTGINEQTVPELPRHVRFVGSASAGTDHVDEAWLKKTGVIFCSSAGCNAHSVAEYIITSLLVWAEKNGKNLEALKTGIVGVGHVGQAVDTLLKKCGLRTVLYDPPREQREEEFTSATLEEILSCDILSFHTPLTRSGKYPTWHWLDKQKLSGNHFSLIINAARGGVVNEQALIRAINNGTVDHAVTDVWEDEPFFSDEMFMHSFIATPHIAGYSIQAKTRATAMIMKKLCSSFDISYKGLPEEQWAEPRHVRHKEFGQNQPSLTEILAKLHPFKRYQSELEKFVGISDKIKGNKFSQLRTKFPYRNEFDNIYLPAPVFKKSPLLDKIGFGKINQ